MPSAIFTILLGLVLLFYLYKRLRRVSLSKVPGPPSSSFLYGVFMRIIHSPSSLAINCVFPGNLPELVQSQSGEVIAHSVTSQTLLTSFQADFKWTAKYGRVIRIKAPLGVGVPSNP
jgi:hypothetical protein